MTLLGGRAFVKTGAEGVFCAAIPERGLGVALKVDDGAGRAAEVMMAHVVHGFCTMSAAEARSFQRFLRPILRNWRGTAVGEIRAVEPLLLL
jgi:L-asparaginase II